MKLKRQRRTLDLSPLGKARLLLGLGLDRSLVRSENTLELKRKKMKLSSRLVPR